MICGILKSRREHDCRHEQPDAVDTGMHMSVRYDGAVRRRHLLTNIHSLNRICLSYQKPMEVIAHGAGDVVELPLTGDKSCRCI